MSEAKTLVMLLAGGKGERLYPLTRDRAKPAVPFGGIYRIIDFSLSNCVLSELRRIIVLTQYKSISLNRHIQLGWNIFSPEMGEFIEIIPAQQRVGEKWYQGTADAIFQNIYTLQKETPDYVVILSGDHVYKMDYRLLHSFHQERKADLTIAAVEMPIELASRFGVIESDAEGRIREFHEKPAHPSPTPHNPATAFVSMGVYIFNTDILVRSVIEDAKKDTEHDFGKNIIPAIIKTHRVFAYNFRDGETGQPGYWKDIGTLDAYYEANRDLIQVTPVFNLYERSWPIRTYQPPCPPVKMVFWEEHTDGRVGTALNSLLSPGCIVSGGWVQGSILSPHVHIHSHARVENSILMEEAEVSRRAQVRNAIIDKGVVVPEGMRIGYDRKKDRKRFTLTEKGIVVVPKEMIL